MRLRGVNYDVGRGLEGRLMRLTFDAKIVHRELEIIKDDLHCNTVKIQGLDIERVVAAGEDALAQGLEVWLAPEMFERSQGETFDCAVRPAAAVGTLRQRWPERVGSYPIIVWCVVLGVCFIRWSRASPPVGVA
jgi:hypothetical protein